MRMQSYGAWNSDDLTNPHGSRQHSHSPTQALRRRNTLIVLVLGISISFLIVLGAALLLSLNREPPAPDPVNLVENPAPPVNSSATEMEDVIVPIKNIEPGQPLDATIVTRVSIPRNAMPLGAVRNVEELEGYFAKGAIPANQPIVRTFLSKERPANPLVPLIPSGYRAVTINVTATSSVEGWARAGARVDVEWISKSKEQPAILAIVQNAKVLSAERRLDPNSPPGAPAPTTVTLLVSELEAQKISLTSATGALVLHMRGTSDKQFSRATSVELTLQDLLRGPGDDSGDPGATALVTYTDSNGEKRQYAVIDHTVMRSDISKKKNKP